MGRRRLTCWLGTIVALVTISLVELAHNSEDDSQYFGFTSLPQRIRDTVWWRRHSPQGYSALCDLKMPVDYHVSEQK